MTTSYKPLIVGFFCAILTTIQTYLSMGQYANQLSSSCTSCSFNEVLIKYVTFLIFIPIVIIHFILNFYKKDYLSVTVVIIYLIFIWLKIINTDIFETRVSDWSSFSNYDIDSFVFKQSFLPILICTIVYLLFHFLLNKYSKKLLHSHYE
jgi:hypothetical protein